MATKTDIRAIKAARRKKLAELLDKFGKVELSKLTDINADYLWQMGKGSGKSARGVNDDNARKIEAATGNPPFWMDSDDDAPSAPVSAPATASDYVRAVDMGMEGDMGDGRVNDDHPEVIRAVDYAQQYIRGLIGFVPAPGRLVLVTGRGDSMAPTIQPGESLLVDTGVVSYDGDGVYLVNLGNGQQIKRLVDHGGSEGVHVHSDNKAYPSLPFPKGGIVAGKVYLRNRVDRFN